MLSNVFSQEDIEYILQLPEVIRAKDRLCSTDKVQFSITVTPSIRQAVKERLGLDLTSEIPMRWIKGDTPKHTDKASKEFKNTYLVYLNDSEGEFILEGASYPITANTGYVFNEGSSHETQNTVGPRLLVGPMSELAEPVGSPVFISYYNNYSDAFNQNFANEIAGSYSYILGDISYGDISTYVSWQVASVTYEPEFAISTPTEVYANGFDMSTLCAEGGINTTFFFVYPVIPCFLEGTKILCQVDGVETYIPIEQIQLGTLVKTSKNGFKKVELLGKRDIENPGDDSRIKDRLYKCSPDAYPELQTDLFITGCHSILVDTLTDVQREKTTKMLGRIFVTEKKYRLMACVDERAVPWNSKGSYTVWHLALENTTDRCNYGVYAEGLLVETCSQCFLKRSNMELIE